MLNAAAPSVLDGGGCLGVLANEDLAVVDWRVVLLGGEGGAGVDEEDECDTTSLVFLAGLGRFRRVIGCVALNALAFLPFWTTGAGAAGLTLAAASSAETGSASPFSMGF
jgi:hypothetical protein